MAREIYPTQHLLQQMRERHVAWGEIVEIVNNPDVVYGDKSSGQKMYQKGKLAVVVAREGDVLTVLLRETKKWNDHDARNR